MNNTVRNVLAVIAVLLLLLFCWSLYSGMQKSKQIADLENQNNSLSTEMSDLEVLKSNLETEIDSLQGEFEGLTIVNDSLANSLVSANNQVNRNRRTISKLRADMEAGDLKNESLSVQIAQLMEEKNALQDQINSIQEENAMLREKAGLLEEDLSKARNDNAALANLNRTMQGEIDNLTLKNFKATAFQVELEKRNNKATAKSRRARRLKASFDLTQVPDKYQGVRPLYLVVTDETSSPIPSENPIKAQVRVNDQVTEIIAIAQKEVDIESNQRISFTHDLDEKLKRGFYRVTVYTDIGILGSSNFRLQ